MRRVGFLCSGVYTFDARAFLIHSPSRREARPRTWLGVAAGERWGKFVSFFRTCAEKSLHAGAIRPSCGRTVAFRLSVVATCMSVGSLVNS